MKTNQRLNMLIKKYKLLKNGFYHDIGLHYAFDKRSQSHFFVIPDNVKCQEFVFSERTAIVHSYYLENTIQFEREISKVENLLNELEEFIKIDLKLRKQAQMDIQNGYVS